MAKHKTFSNSESSTHGDGTCSHCHKKIVGLYMVTHFYDMKSRGKEGDRITTRCEKCIDPNDKAYIKYQNDMAKEADRQALQAERDANDPYRFTKVVASSCEYDSEYDGRTYTHCYYCDANIGDGEKHKDYCMHLEAQKVLEENGIEYETE